MLIYTGMRIGELFSLPLDDYHETYVVVGEKTEAGRNRVIPILPAGRSLFCSLRGAGGWFSAVIRIHRPAQPQQLPQAGLLPPAGPAGHPAKDPARCPAHLCQPGQEKRYAAGNPTKNFGPCRLQHYREHLCAH